MSEMDITKYPITEIGSVKNIRMVSEPTDTRMGEAIFEFTDDTSVRDRGKLGFATPMKGVSMATTAIYNFERMEARGIPTIFREKVASNAILVDAVRVINPDEFNLSGVRTNRLFPIEVITRDVVTATSSAARRLREGSLAYQALGLSEMPTEFPVFLPKTFVDGSTKLRSSGDAYLPWDQLKEMAYATTGDVNTVQAYVLATTAFAQERGGQIGFLVFDHKDEYAHNERGNLILADAPLCLDEITGALVGSFSDLDVFRGSPFSIFQAGVNHDPAAHINVSKQLFRDHYDAAHPEWVAAVKTALQANTPKDQLPIVPQPPEQLVGIVSSIYQAFANEWTGTRTFDVPDLASCVDQYRVFAQQFYELN